MERESSSTIQANEENVGIEIDNVVNMDDEVEEPKVGMMFDSYEDLFDYYTTYGKRLGFPVKRRSSTKSDDGQLKYISVACSG